jgi:hypothetical protein
VHEDLHHVFFRICRHRGCRAGSIGGNIEWFVIVKHLDHVAWGRSADDRGGDDLVHSLVVGWVRRVVDEAGSAGVDGAGEESHSNGALVGDALERPDQVGAFQVLGKR